MKLAMVISSLSGGGAERVMAVLAGAWARRGWDVSVISIASAHGDAYSLPREVRRIGLGLERCSENPVAAIVHNVARIRRIRAELRDLQPDIVMSFLTSTNVLTLLAAKTLAVPVVVSERVSPIDFQPSAIWRALRRYTYRRAAAVVAQTERGAKWLREHIPGASVCVIPNPVQVIRDETPDAVTEAIVHTCNGRDILLAAGRLERQKGFDLLLRAFGVLAAKYPDWRLVVLGEGPERDRLQALANGLGVADRVMFPGFSNTPYALMRKATIFVLSSRFEGMPTALLEAMACGLPCVSFDCRTGPAELIEHGTNGLLVPPEDVDALVTATDRLMQDRALRDQLGRAAQVSAESYALELIIARWEDLFREKSVRDESGL